MAVLKIPQSQQQVRAAGQSGSVDIRLPLSLAQQQGAAFSSLGKVYEDIYKEQRDIEDKKEFYKVTKEVGLDITKISKGVQGNTDLEFSHKTFDELTQPDKYEYLLKDKNKNVRKLFDQWLLKTKDKEYSTIANKVIQNSNDEIRASIDDKADELTIKMASSDLVEAQTASDDLENLFNQKSTKRVFSDDEYKKFVKDKKNQGVRYRLQLGAKNNSVFTLKNIKDIEKSQGTKVAEEIKEIALNAIANDQSNIDRDDRAYEEKTANEKVAIFAELAFRIKNNDNAPDLDLLNDLFKDDQINSAQYDALLRFAADPNKVGDNDIFDQINALYYTAETIEELDQLDRMIHLTPEYLLSVGIKDVDTMHKLIEKSKDRAVFQDIKFYQKKIADITGQIDSGGFLVTRDFMSGATKEQNIRSNAIRNYDEYIADGLNPQDAFFKTATGFIMQNDRLPTIYQVNQVNSIKISEPTETQKKKNSSEIFEGWRNSVMKEYKLGNINIDELKRDLDNLDLMEDLFNVRSQFGNDFAFSTSNDLSKDKKKEFDGAG